MTTPPPDTGQPPTTPHDGASNDLSNVHNNSKPTTSTPTTTLPYAEPQDNECSICLDDLTTITTLDCCTHTYCLDCIRNWVTKISSDCPLCKSRIRELHYTDPDTNTHQHIDVAERIQVDPDAPPSVLYAVCLVCSTDTDEAYLLLCDGCDRAYHTWCVGLERNVPDGEWKCATCTQAESVQPQRTQQRRQRSRRLRRADSVEQNNERRQRETADKNDDDEYKPSDDDSDAPQRQRQARTAQTSATAQRVRQLRHDARQQALTRRINKTEQRAVQMSRKDQTDDLHVDYSRAAQLAADAAEDRRIAEANRRHTLMSQYVQQNRQAAESKRRDEDRDPKLAALSRKYADMLYNSYDKSHAMKQINSVSVQGKQPNADGVHNNAFTTAQMNRLQANHRLHHEVPTHSSASTLSLSSILDKQKKQVVHTPSTTFPTSQYRGVEFSKVDQPGQYARTMPHAPVTPPSNIIHIDAPSTTTDKPNFEFLSFDDFVESSAQSDSSTSTQRSHKSDAERKQRRHDEEKRDRHSHKHRHDGRQQNQSQPDDKRRRTAGGTVSAKPIVAQ